MAMVNINVNNKPKAMDDALDFYGLKESSM
jgi:hypothetical protein